jgi:hypothetical protein
MMGAPKPYSVKEDFKHGGGQFFGQVQKMYEAGTFQPGRRYRTNTLCEDIPVAEAKERNRAHRMSKLIRADYGRGSVFDGRGSVYDIWDDDDDDPEGDAQFVNERLKRRSTVNAMYRPRGSVAPAQARSPSDAVAEAAALREELARPSVDAEAPVYSDSRMAPNVQVVPPARAKLSDLQQTLSDQQPSFFFDLTDGADDGISGRGGQNSAPAPNTFRRVQTEPKQQASNLPPTMTPRRATQADQIDVNAPTTILSQNYEVGGLTSSWSNRSFGAPTPVSMVRPMSNPGLNTFGMPRTEVASSPFTPRSMSGQYASPFASTTYGGGAYSVPAPWGYGGSGAQAFIYR